MTAKLQRFATLRANRLRGDGGGDKIRLEGMEQPSAKIYTFKLAMVFENAKMTDFHKTWWQGMKEETAHKFDCGNSHGLLFPVVFVVFIGKNNRFSEVIVGDDPTVGNTNAICVAGKIFYDVVRAMIRFFQVAEELGAVQGVFERIRKWGGFG